MANSASPFDSPSARFAAADVAPPRPRARALGRDASSLSSVIPGESVRVVAVTLDADLAAWLAAVGIASGDVVTVLRRAVFGGPIHVRTSAGGEFALARSLARAITIRAHELDAE
jgi:Fe2+ transport system protein FeoA